MFPLPVYICFPAKNRKINREAAELVFYFLAAGKAEKFPMLKDIRVCGRRGMVFELSDELK